MTSPLLAAHDPRHGGDALAHAQHKSSEREVLDVLRSLGIAFDVVDAPWDGFDVRGACLIITVGGDGTLLTTSHNLDGRIPILGINSAPSSSVGFFCGLAMGQCARGIPNALQGKMPAVELARMQVQINRKIVSRRVLNDALFCHASPAATSRYTVSVNGSTEDHKSSGFWIGPAAGSTAAQRSAGGRILPLESRDLQFIVREPFSYAGKPKLDRCLVREGQSLRAVCNIREGKLFLDGPHVVHDIGPGSTLVFSCSKEPLTVLGIHQRRRGRVAVD